MTDTNIQTNAPFTGIIIYHALPEMIEKNNKYVEDHIYLLDEKIDTEQCIYKMLNFDGHYKRKQQIIMLDVAKVMKYLKAFSKIESFKTIRYPIDKAKYLCSIKNLLELKVDEPPTLVVDDKSSKTVAFENGRNRFANLRRAGARYMPFLVYKRDVKRLVEWCR